jgi:tetratricopeptide (TPR) repeat protein
LRVRSVRVVLGGALAAWLGLFSCAPPREPAVAPDTSRAKRFFIVGDYEEAINAYAEIAGQYPGDKTVLGEYVSTVGEIKAQADSSFEAGDYPAAESTYLVLAANFPRFSAFEGSLSFTLSQLRQRILDCQTGLSERRARQALAAGDYLKTLDSYKDLPLEVLREERTSSGLKRIMEELKRLADTALARKDFVAAGKGYAALVEGDPLAERAGISFPSNKKAAEEGLKKCRAQLTKDGLDQYRKGRLKEAITIWRGLLEFDPDNAEIRKAAETASEQLEKLKHE